MSEMVERVARAISAERWGREEQFDMESDAWRNAHRDMARAAIAAMREPIEAMLKAEGPLGRRVDNYLDDWDAIDVWQAMINEALK